MLEIRPGVAADAAGVLAIYAPHVTAGIATFETDMPTVDDVAGRISAAQLWLVACDGADIVGYAYASAFRPRAAYRFTAETTVYLARAAQGQGLGRRLYEQLLPALRDLGIATAVATIALPNPASVGLHTSVGFRPVGVLPGAGWKLGRWIDVGWWSLRLRDLSAPDVAVTPARV